MSIFFRSPPKETVASNLADQAVADPLLDELVGKATKISEFHNVNVDRVDYAQLNQRLRCATTDEQVDNIMGTPSGALGPGSIISLIPNRKKKQVTKLADATVSSERSSSRARSVVDGQSRWDETPENLQLPPARQKALFKGRYFPSFGLLCPPLAGTEIFPISPNMEKLHFAVAADMPMDHFDGEPQQQYLDDIKQYMEPIFESYQLSNKDKYLNRFKNPNFNQEWASKFPYASHRFQEGNAIRRKVGPDEVFKVNFDTNPNLLDNYKENLNPDILSEKHGKGKLFLNLVSFSIGSTSFIYKLNKNLVIKTDYLGSKFRHEQLQVATSIQAQQYETRQVGYSASQMKEESSDSLVFSDETGRKFDKFLNLSKNFFAKGYKTIPFHQQVPMLELHTFTTYEQFEDWIFQVKDQNEVPNATHEKCLMMTPWKDHFSTTQRLKINGWLGTLFKMDRIKLIKRKVYV